MTEKRKNCSKTTKDIKTAVPDYVVTKSNYTQMQKEEIVNEKREKSGSIFQNHQTNRKIAVSALSKFEQGPPHYAFTKKKIN